MLHGLELAATLSKIKLVAVHGPWYRVVPHRFLLRKPPDPLWASGSKIAGARFTPKGGPDSLYLSSDGVTVLAEVNALVILPGGPVPLLTEPHTVFAVGGIVTRVVDLTDQTTLAALGTNTQAMTGDWLTMRDPPTQLLGRAAYDSGIIAAIQYGSAKNPGQKNIVVFPDRLVAPTPDFLEVHDPHNCLTQRIGAA